VLYISQTLLEATLRHLQSEAPLEGVGLWAGISSRVIQVIPLQNTHPAPQVAYTADPVLLIEAMQNLQASGLELLAIYHSHPVGPALPSESDRAQAFWRVAYVIVGLGNTIRAWKLPSNEEIPLHVD
jgi:proteasome lid subunit RPN8/RPN11